MVESGKLFESAPTITLNNGVKMPMIGFGTFDNCAEIESLIIAAVLEHGYRHIDTASIYGNEEAIGRGLKHCFENGIKREDLFIVTKIWKTDYANPEEAIKKSLQKLQLDYVDLYLVHWMCPEIDHEKYEIARTPMHKLWHGMEGLVKAGLTKSIGVSNATIPILFDMLSYCEIKPVVNQIELHPHFASVPFVQWHKKFGIEVTAYAPLGAKAWPFKNPLYKDLDIFTEPVIVDLAKKYGKSTGQVVLNWHLNQGHIIIPKTATAGRLKENLEVYDFKLTDDEYKSITALDRGARLYDPLHIPGYGWNNCPYYS